MRLWKFVPNSQLSRFFSPLHVIAEKCC